jgi:hypothetical protein
MRHQKQAQKLHAPEMRSQSLMVVILQHIHHRVSTYPKAAQAATQHHGCSNGVVVSNAGHDPVIHNGNSRGRKVEAYLQLIGKAGADEWVRGRQVSTQNESAW